MSVYDPLQQGDIRCHFASQQIMPLIVEDTSGKTNLLEWAADHRETILACQTTYGAVLFRGFDFSGREAFEEFITITSCSPISYSERSSPRESVGGKIYTSTSYRADQGIFLHNEQSYNLSFPRCIYFYSDTVAEQGGETPMADTRKIFARLPEALQCKLMDKGYLYQRNFNRSFGLTWQEAFQLEDKESVSQYCRDNHIDYHWHDSDSDIKLTTRQRREAVAVHPITGEKCWFNHCTFFNFYTLEPEIQEALKLTFDLQDMPNHTLLGDGSELSEHEVDQLKDAYLKEKVMVPWRKNDVLMMDNILSSHGRESFTGERLVLVGMSDVREWLEVKMMNETVLEI